MCFAWAFSHCGYLNLTLHPNDLQLFSGLIFLQSLQKSIYLRCIPIIGWVHTNLYVL
jgi:hypothetical protein